MEQVYNNLTQLIKEHDKIIIMTHRNPDFDGMGSAIALQQIINSFKKESYICKNYQEKNKTLIKAYESMEQKEIVFNTLTKEESKNYCDKSTLLIIMDVHKKEMVEEPELLDLTENVVVIDHHIKSKNSIENTVFTYINANLSSTVEFMVNYLKYLNKVIDPFLATIMEVGLEIDTNSFKLKTTDKTFETAAYLSKIGADNVLKQELLQESKEVYLKNHKIIEKSFMINSNMAMCLTDEEVYEKKNLAIIAEQLLQFENVEASFVIGEIDHNLVGVSARSLGNIDVEKFMTAIGGGGHTNEAAAQIANKTKEEVKKMIINVIGG